MNRPQFMGCDSPDTRKLIFRLLDEFGHALPEMEAAERRARWLRRLIAFSDNGFARKMVKITPLDPVSAYNAFVAITGVLGVPIEDAVRILEEEIRRKPANPHEMVIARLAKAKAEIV